jgi:hypothetical protein
MSRGKRERPSFLICIKVESHSFVMSCFSPVGFPRRTLAAIYSQQERALRYALKGSFVASVGFDG